MASHELRHRFRPGSRQDLDAPAVGELDRAQGHDLETGIDPLADPFRTCRSRASIGPSAALSRLHRPFASCHCRARPLLAVRARVHGLAWLGLQGRFLLLGHGGDLFSLLPGRSLAWLGFNRCVHIRRPRERLRRGGLRRGRRGSGGWNGCGSSLGRRIDPWPRRLRVAGRCSSKQAKGQARIPEPI